MDTFRTVAKWIAVATLAVAVVVLIPIIWTERQCVAPTRSEAVPVPSLLQGRDHRAEVDSYLTYPEWSIVYSYEDFAAVTRQGSESDFRYFGSITDYWSSLCSIRRYATGLADVPRETSTMLYVIGLSYALEMGVKGAYEETIGRLTAWLRGPERTAEDEFALKVADDYVAFLRQTPWYRYPFATRLKEFWLQTPVTGGNLIRKVERRFALSLEYAAKAIYAKGIGFLAGLDPAVLRIRSVVDGLTKSDVDADKRIVFVKAVDETRSIIETPRYRIFTDILRKLALDGRNFVEIAGNNDILVTVKAPPDVTVDPNLGTLLFEVPIQSSPGWRRQGLSVKIPALAAFIRHLSTSTVTLEHVYDY